MQITRAKEDEVAAKIVDVDEDMEEKEERDVYLLSKKFSHVTFGPREDRVQVSHVLDSDLDCTDTPDFKTSITLSYGLQIGGFFFC